MIGNTGYSDDETDEEERHRFFSVCAENKLNAMIARMREFDENFDRPEEFENEAVTMAIQQHGLKNCENESPSDSLCDCKSEINENHCNQNLLVNSPTLAPTTSMSMSSTIINTDKECNLDDDKCSKRKPRRHSNKTDLEDITYMQTCSSGAYEFDDVDFLNKAVAVAISNKGLSSTSSCDALQ
ncbi:hypothetical protein RUM43_015045 [Polyplax serrata]|uniref:Uncharacterized protein n=1 Tax=Polyplax serrata TaxID=468196 RepID=A0AAN8S9H0_POLSC